MSGRTPYSSMAKGAPQRPMPLWISSAMSSAPWRAQAAATACTNAGVQIEGAGLALHGFEDHAGDGFVDHARGCRRVVARDELHVEGRAGKAVPFADGRPGHRRRRRGAPMKAVLDRENLAPARNPAGQAQRVLVGLSAAVAEEDAIQAGRREVDQLGAQPARGPPAPPRCSGRTARAPALPERRGCPGGRSRGRPRRGRRRNQ